jgi:hypothetical protein
LFALVERLADEGGVVILVEEVGAEFGGLAGEAFDGDCNAGFGEVDGGGGGCGKEIDIARKTGGRERKQGRCGYEGKKGFEVTGRGVYERISHAEAREIRRDQDL